MLRIRKMSEPDFPAVCGLIQETLGYGELKPEAIMERLKQVSGRADWATFVAFAEDEIVGFVGIMKGISYIDEYTKIMGLAVVERARRSGVGRALTEKAEEWARTQGVDEVQVSTGMKRLGAHAFYRNNGYVEKASQRYYFVKKIK